MISIKDVTFKYAGREEPALRDINLEINQGDFLVVTGPTGGGKSTLLRLFNGLIPHFYRGTMSGSVSVDGRDTRSMPVARLARTVAVVFQSPEDQMIGSTVERDVAFALENQQVPTDEMRKRVDATLADLGIDGLRHRPPQELSGGEKQLVAIAAAIASGARVLALDEPTAELDQKSAGTLFELLQRLHTGGVTIAVVEHRLGGLLPIATRAAVLDEGRLVADISPRELVEPRFERMGIGLPPASRVALTLRRLGVDAGRPISNKELTSRLDDL